MNISTLNEAMINVVKRQSFIIIIEEPDSLEVFDIPRNVKR